MDESGIDVSTRGPTNVARAPKAGNIGEEDPDPSWLTRRRSEKSPSATQVVEIARAIERHGVRENNTNPPGYSVASDMFKIAIPVIHVSDSATAEEFYCKRLGFSLLFSYRPDETKSDPAI